MTPGLRKFALSAHLAFSVGWIGAVIVYLAFGVAAATVRDDQTMRAAWIAMDLAGWYVIVPLALASLLTGVVMALGTRWGLVRHHWVLFSLTLTSFATVVLLLHMPGVSELADLARQAGSTVDPHLSDRLSEGDLLHPGLGLVVLLTIQVLNVYKPPGMTRYGRRRQQEQRALAREHSPVQV
jgi:hypothetical protein